MTEDEYILVTNKTSITAAIDAMKQTMDGDKWVITSKERAEVFNLLYSMQQRLFRKIEIMEVIE